MQKMTLILFAVNAAVLVYGGVIDGRRREIPDIVPLVLLFTGLLRPGTVLPRLMYALAVMAGLLIADKTMKGGFPGGDFKLLCTLAFAYGAAIWALTLLLTGIAAIAWTLAKNHTLKGSVPLCSFVAPAFIIVGAVLQFHWICH